MLTSIESNTLNMRQPTVLYGPSLGLALALMSTSAVGQCTNWDASDGITVVQRGQNTNIWITIKQNGKVITGSAGSVTNDRHLIGGVLIGGDPIDATVDGTINGDTISFQIFWKEGLTGVYNAKILPSGRLDGETYDKNNSSIRQTWHSEGVLNCPPPPNPVQSAPPAPKPIKRTGRLPIEETPESKLRPPDIIASQVVFPAPGYPTGSITLTWDGGPDHPNAEVRVKVNNGDETSVVKLGKGARTITVERGKSYQYFLTDAGKTLSNVSFLVPR